uniref:Uncharacterized protein n=1 Tax=Meloidogyne enterolobii TaxID=390850 RepID=A0A6V7X317_MELEN|nr:unnamed protein product [Meloidogyne enterolobii]
MALGPKVNVIINTIYLPKYGKVGEDRCIIEIYNGCTVAELIDMARCQIANDSGTVWDDNPQFRVYLNGQELSMNSLVSGNRMYIIDVIEHKDY